MSDTPPTVSTWEALTHAVQNPTPALWIAIVVVIVVLFQLFRSFKLMYGEYQEALNKAVKVVPLNKVTTAREQRIKEATDLLTNQWGVENTDNLVASLKDPEVNFPCHLVMAKYDSQYDKDIKAKQQEEKEAGEKSEDQLLEEELDAFFDLPEDASVIGHLMISAAVVHHDIAEDQYKLVDDPRYAKYFAMVEEGLDASKVKEVMKVDGVQPDVLDMDKESFGPPSDAQYVGKLDWLVIEPNQRGRQLGKYFLQESLWFCRAMGIEKLRLACPKGLKSIFESIGGEVDDSFPLAADQGIIMEVDISHLQTAGDPAAGVGASDKPSSSSTSSSSKSSKEAKKDK